MNFNRDIRPRYRLPHMPQQPAPMAPQVQPQQPHHQSQPQSHHHAQSQVHAQPKPKKVQKIKFWQGRKWWAWALAAAVVVLIAFLTYGYINTKNELSKAKNSNTNSANPESSEILTEVGKLIDLPQGEKPTIATINDASKLKNQEFFANSQNGDKVIIFAKSNRAVLYRPSTNKIIEYSKVNFDSGQ